MKLNLLIALSFGIIASSSGVVQVRATDYNFFVDFSTKEVADFTDYRQSFNIDTYNLDSVIKIYFTGTYRFNTCTPNFTLNPFWEAYYQLNGTGSIISLGSSELPDMPCRLTNTTYFATLNLTIPNNVVNNFMNDDANFVRFQSRMGLRTPGSGIILTLSGYRNYFEISYDFNTTYLFNKFLTDVKFHNNTASAGTGGTWTRTATQETELQYVFTTAGNDAFYVINTASGPGIGTTRKKYAVDYNNEFFRGESVGAQFTTNYTGSDTLTFGTSTATQDWRYDWYFLNVANLAQAIVDAPTLSFTEEDCGDFLSLNVGCFINNAFAYIVNDAPVISDAFTLLNAGIEMAAQTFGIIGNFADDNVFGVLILAGFGFIAVKWFLKND